MPVQHAPIDFIAYDADGAVVLLLEAKSRHGISDSWAAKLRRNILAHGGLPNAMYFLIATPERMYGWKLEAAELSPHEVPPDFTVDAQKVLAPYFAKFNQDPANIGPRAFELLVLTWLTDMAKSPENRLELDPSLSYLSESGLLSSLRHAEIEMNPAR
ncbi:MAG: hypothetical protein ABJF23_23505 [Bryobacteraceae bacterium]